MIRYADYMRMMKHRQEIERRPELMSNDRILQQIDSHVEADERAESQYKKLLSEYNEGDEESVEPTEPTPNAPDFLDQILSRLNDKRLKNLGLL